jgi:hypothetical protein
MTRSNKTSFIRPVPGQGMICFKCGQGHRASQCDFTGSCDQCGKTGHMKVVCKQNPNAIIKWQFTSPPSAGSTASFPSGVVPSGARSSYGSVQMMMVPQVAPPQFPPHPYQLPYFGYYGHAPPLPAPYAPLQLPAPPQPQQIAGDSSTSIAAGVFNKPTTSSLGHQDGVSGTPFPCCMPTSVHFI